MLRVVDDGIGFDPDVLDRKVAEGHIGLASLVVGVEAMGGAVRFARTPGGGTTTIVTMPVRSPAPTARLTRLPQMGELYRCRRLPAWGDTGGSG